MLYSKIPSPFENLPAKIIKFCENHKGQCLCRSGTKMNFEMLAALSNNFKSDIGVIYLRGQVTKKQGAPVFKMRTSYSVSCVVIVLSGLSEQVQVAEYDEIVLKIW